MKRCSSCILPETHPNITFDNEGVCNYCKSHQKIQYLGSSRLEEDLAKYKTGNGKYDCLVPISGGKDSTYVLYQLSNVFGMRALAYNYDNCLTHPQAQENVRSVAVTVFKTIREMIQIHRELKADYLQLHGDFHQLKSIADIPFKKRIIRAIDGGASNALDLAIECSFIFQSVLLDTSGKGGIGGTGIPHDWYSTRVIRDVIHPSPLILAGGLTPENIGNAIRIVQPYGVDVSSGVEKIPGVKDHRKMLRFIAEVKKVEK